MTTKCTEVESTGAEDMGQFLNHLNPDTRKITRRLEKLQLKIINNIPLSLIKLDLVTTCCLNIHSSLYIYIYIYIYNLSVIITNTLILHYTTIRFIDLILSFLFFQITIYICIYIYVYPEI